MPRMPTTATLRSSQYWTASQWHQLRGNGHASFGRSHGQRTRWLRGNWRWRGDRASELCEKAMRFPATDPKTADGQLSKQLKAWIVARKAKPFETAQLQVASIRISADSQTISTKPGQLTANHRSRSPNRSLNSIPSDRSSRHPGNGSQPAMTPAKLQRSLLEHRERFIQEHPKFPSIGSTSPSLLKILRP